MHSEKSGVKQFTPLRNRRVNKSKHKVLYNNKQLIEVYSPNFILYVLIFLILCL